MGHKCPAPGVLFPSLSKGHSRLFACGRKINTNRNKNVSDVGEVTAMETSRESYIGLIKIYKKNSNSNNVSCPL